MVRETRHLWVGNLPDNIREDRIREHFKRYGRVQNVKLLGRTESMGGSTTAPAAGSSGVCATVAFMDIKSASKAHNVEHVLDERTLTTEYYEPSAIPAGAPSAGSSPAGSGYSGSSSSVNSASAPLPAAPAVVAATATSAPSAATATRYHLSGSEEVSATCALAATAAAPANWRGTNDSASEYSRRGSTPAAYGRYARTTATTPYATPPNGDRSLPRWYSGGGSSGGGGATGGSSTPSTPGGGTECGVRRRRSGSGSSRSDSSSADSEGSRASTPHGAAPTAAAHHHHRPLAICVRNLPARSTDSSLKDGLYHEYKKHGKVVWVKVVGQNADRYAVVRFKKPSDVEKALEVSQDKLFFGCKISVAPHQSCDEDADSAKPYETDIDEYHPKATRTLFIGNLEKDVTQQQLRDKFKHFGRIIEIDIKKGSGGGAGYAFCQYAAISSVVEAIRSMDGEYVGGSRVKLGFGKPVATTCVWVDGLTETTEKQVLACVTRCGAATSVCVDRAAGAALVHFEQAGAAGAAVRELRRVAAHASAAEPERPRLAVDYASRECQEAFYEQLEKHGGSAALAGVERAPADPAAPVAAPRYPPGARHDPLRYESCPSRSRASSYSRSTSRTPRYTTLEHYDPADYAADRRYRVYDELGDSPPPEDIALYEDRLLSVVVSSPHRSRRHRRDSSPEDRKHSKERHRSVTLTGLRRSRSGSRGGERHAGRRRHRRRCGEGSSSLGSRAGTPLRDEVEAMPCEPRRGPRERPPRPMSLPLPRFALQLPPPGPRPAPAAAPDSPPRPHSASSSSAGSAPHSPSIEERIRSLDEKLSGSRGAPDTPDRARLRHHLLDLNINEVKPSEVVRSLLAKRSVFDEDSERLEGAGRAPSPVGSPRPRPPPSTPRALRYPFPVHPPAATTPTTFHTEAETQERPGDPRLNRPDRPYVLERLTKFNESDYKPESRVRLRTPSIDKVQCDSTDRSQSPRSDGERLAFDKGLKKNSEPMRRNSMNSVGDGEWKERQSSNELETAPKRRDSIHSVRDALIKREIEPVESDSNFNRRDSHNSIENVHIKFERSLSTESETDPKSRDSTTICRENLIKTEKDLSAEANSKRQDSPQSIEEAPSIKDTQLPAATSSEIIVNDLMIHNKEVKICKEETPSISSECKRTAYILNNHETDLKNEKLWSIEAEEREIKEAIQRIDEENKDIQSLIHDDKINQKTMTVESHKGNATDKLESDTVCQLEKSHKNSSSSPTSDVSRNILESQSEKHSLSNSVSVAASEILPISESIVKLNNETDKSNIDKFNETICETSEEKLVKNDTESELCKDILIQNHINKELLEFEMQHSHLHSLNSIKPSKNISEIGQELLKNHEKNGKEKYNQNVIIEAFHTKLEKENIQFDRQISKDSLGSNSFTSEKKTPDNDKHTATVRGKSDREKPKHSRDRFEKNNEKEKSKNHRSEKSSTDKKCKEETGSEKSHDKKTEKETDGHHKEKSDRDKSRHSDERKSRHDHHRKDRSNRDDEKKREKKKEDDAELSKTKKEDKHKHERSKNMDSKRDVKKDSEAKSRKSSRDESSNNKDKDLHRKDSTDSSTSRASHDSTKPKDLDHQEIKEELHPKLSELFPKQDSEKESLPKILDSQVKLKAELKEDKDQFTKNTKYKLGMELEIAGKSKTEATEKLRHYSLDSPNVDCKRKERLNSCSSLPSNLGQKRRISSQDCVDSVSEDMKKVKHTMNTAPERRDSDSRASDRPKTTKFNKGHFAKIIESKTKDDKKNQVKPPDVSFLEDLNNKKLKSDTKPDQDEKALNDPQLEGLHNDLDFLATLELRSSEEDERQKALRKEMKEKKRIQQLQQIQELQMQQDALQHAEIMAKLKDEKKKIDDKKKEARDKRMSIERKSREDKSDSGRRKNRKQLGTDSSDSDEPKKHSIFDVVDDEPAYISMYDKVKARSCKNMQKQEEEKRQEKIKAKFSQLKQSRAKREEKKRSSWDEDSDSENDRRRQQKSSVDTSTDDEHFTQNKKFDKLHGPAFEFHRNKINDFFSAPSNEEDSHSKLSRKNSRSRIISDTSDDDGSKISFSKSPSFFSDIRKEFMTDYESLQRIRDEMTPKESNEINKKNSLLNLFGKSDSDDSKLKSSFNSSEKYSLSKTMSNDLSSEGENAICNRILNESRKRHKKKQKKHKFSFSDDECKTEGNELNSLDCSKFENRRHGTKKEKRKEKFRESNDADDTHDDRTKIKKDKKISSFDSESNLSNKKDGRMEDIFGPISDDSDGEDAQTNKEDLPRNEFASTFRLSNAEDVIFNNEESKVKEDCKIKRDKKRKEKRLFMKDDENSLDVDAVSKAIEARLFAETNDDDDDQDLNKDIPLETISKSNHEDFDHKIEKYNDKVKRDCKKKKKKKNREDRMNRRDHQHHPFNHHHEKRIELNLSGKSIVMLPLPMEAQQTESIESQHEKKPLPESPSLPRLTDSPPIATRLTELEIKNRDSDATDCSGGDHNMDLDTADKKAIEVDIIPMALSTASTVKCTSEAGQPISLESESIKVESRNVDSFLPSFARSINISEDAIRSLANIEKDSKTEKIDILSPKTDKKLEEKPRAIISQEETEDAVAALLGESFGEKGDTFASYEEVDNNTTRQIEVERSVTVNENILDEDAEEMRQAVQNLNASEMEMKPDTPVSDNDMLLIDTDTEEADDTAQDSLGRLTGNVITTSHSSSTSEPKSSDVTNLFPSIQKSARLQNLETKSSSSKIVEDNIKIQLTKREPIPQVSSTATPVITSTTLTNNKLIEPHVVNIKATPGRVNDIKPTHITANIVQIHKTTQNPATTALKPIMTTPNRGGASYQVINHVIRPQMAPNMQPPTIKIPESHILYQRPQSIVISPRISNDPRLQSPKRSPQGEGMSSPRLTNVAFLGTSPQNLNAVGLAAANSLQQRSPGQVTVVRMQQPPLSPIQAIHIPPGARTLVSPNRPNSVLVQTQGTPIHLNRLPVTPVLTPLSKQISTGNIVQHNKATGMGNTPFFQKPNITVGDGRRTDHRLGTENPNDHSTIILAPTSLQHSTNPTVMAQNRLISMQNAVHTGNMHLNNKILANDISNLNDKRESPIQKPEQHNHISYSTAPIIRVAGMNQSTASIIHSGSKPIMSTVQDSNPVSRGQGSNVIHTFNSQRLVSKSPISNMIQIESKNSPSVLSMATIRPQTVLAKLESPHSVAVTSRNTNIVMAPLLLKTSTSHSPITCLSSKKNEAVITGTQMSSKFQQSDGKDLEKVSAAMLDRLASDGQKDLIQKPTSNFALLQERITKCETDFEELLKDNTNEIKITNNPDKKLEVNVGKTVSTFPTSTLANLSSTDNLTKEAEAKIHNAKLESAENSKSSITENYKGPEICNVQEQRNESIDNKIISDSEFKAIDNINPFDIANVGPKTNEFEDVECDDMLHLSGRSDDQIKSLDENDSWSGKDINIESVIKKVDSLCNETDTEKSDDVEELMSKNTTQNYEDLAHKESSKSVDIEMATDSARNSKEILDRTVVTGKRGGRSIRGRKVEKNQDKVQTRQIAKPNRGGPAAKRGRGRAKVDKKIQHLINNSINNLPGDIYDFHEDSGDETSAALNKNETRPRLILTIKSPVLNPITPPTLSITKKDEVPTKDQIKNKDEMSTKDLIKSQDKLEKDGKPDEFMSPSMNTRKSRRLQAKDVQRNTVDDVIDDVVKGTTTKSPAKDNKKRQTRQTGVRAGQVEKTPASDTRKSPRGVKRIRDRSLSDASADSNSCPGDSNEEKNAKKEEETKAPEPKIPKLTEPPVTPKSEPDPPQPAKTVVNAPVNTPMAPVNTPIAPQNAAPTPTLIMKPPKKMISEISAKLAGAFEAAASASARPPAPAEAEKPAPVPRDIRNLDFAMAVPDFAMAVPAASELMTAATGDARVGASVEMAMTSGGEAALSRRLEAGAAEAGDARVLSPALPHRPPDAHRLPDRLLPPLIRGVDGEGASLGVGVRAPRPYAGPASLPRGAHHPPALPPAVRPHHPLPHTHHTGAASRVTLTSIPSISPQGQIGLGEGMYPHFSHQHYQMYQQHFRATQHESRASPSLYTRGLEAEGCETPAPPLELRRPPVARVPRPAHSPSPADRLIMYGAGCGRSPPPAHGTSRLPGALPPAVAVGPPHASQVPREADSLQTLLQRYPVMWQGLLALKNDSAAVQMHFVGGSMAVAGDTLPPLNTDGTAAPLRIAQRMRLEPAQLDQVHRKMKMENEHCILLGLPCGRDHMDVLQQSTNLTAGFITYLQQKQAAGIVNVAPPGHEQALYTVHIFPSCDFANENLSRIAPDLMHRVADIAHLLIVIATV